MLRWGMIMLFLPGVLLITHYMIEAQGAATCVQQGGSWDYINGLCDMAKKHEFVSYAQRYGFWVNSGMLISIVGLVIGTIGMLAKGMAQPKDRP